MTTSANPLPLPDADDRERAVATFDHNLVVTAGAGTGKTTLLVDRLIHLLLRNPDPLRITEIVALTFTNKAANEMKQRLRERLQAYLGVELDREDAGDAEKKNQREVVSLITRYQLSKDELDRRIHDAIRNMERSDIGTIHSFAATMLRLYPLEAGVDPQFHEDDGREFDRIFDEQWDLWLDQELALKSSHEGEWRKILGKLTLEPIKALAKSLSSEAVELRGEQSNPNAIAEPLRAWLKNLQARAAALIARHPEERMNEKLIRAAHAVIETFLRAGEIKDQQLDEARALLAGKPVSRSLKGWSEDDIGAAQELVRTAKGLNQVDATLTQLLWQLLVPFAEGFRDHFVRQGFVSFDGLLVRARDLVRDRPRVRQELKRQYRSILIDEFQDTDPVQYEILLYLAELPDAAAKDWRKVKLTPGKIFVVGDPKQSIYAFRRADIEAYLEVVEKIIKAQDGIECRLTTNFRSDGAILEVVNGAFESLIQAQDGVQPPYIAIEPAPGRKSAGPSDHAKVTVRKIVAVKNKMDDEMNAEKARRLEGESLALWLQEEILGKTIILNSQGEAVHVQPKDIAILFRKLTDIHDYLEPFRRANIRYVVEGERHFYAAKEIIDAVNLLRAIENPHDRLALVGVLRSPLGGLTDRQIYDLHGDKLLDYREAQRLSGKTFPPSLADLYAKLAALHDEIRTLPVGAAVTHVFANLPVKLLAACGFHGEQAVANLEKLRQQAELLGREGATTLKAAIHQLQQRVLDVKEEGESVLAEENLDAVRIMSIHKSKGLEFPIVILAGCQAGTDGRHSADGEALFDWSSGLTGLRVGSICDLAGLYLAEKSRRRSEEEQKRVLYVAMTRAREHLVLSCAPSGRRAGGSFVAMLDESLSEAIANAEKSQSVTVGAGKLDLEIVSQTLSAPSRVKSLRKRPSKKTNWQPFVDLWQRRRAAHDRAKLSQPFITPTSLKRQAETESAAIERSGRARYSRTTALMVGDLAHRFLLTCEFAGTTTFEAQLQDFIEQTLAHDSQPNRSVIEAELNDIFHGFPRSQVYAELAGARILGREVPLLMPWSGQIMEGVIDLVYEKNGLLYLADYKTDRIARSELRKAAEPYRQQAEIYCEAARRSLKREVTGFQLIFLRLGEALELTLDKNHELTLF